MFPGVHAQRQPGKPAVIMAQSGEVLAYRELDEASMRAARLFRSRGLGVADHVVFLVGNELVFSELAWGAQRAGLYFTVVDWHLTPDEAAYIVNDTGASVVVASSRAADLARELPVRCPAVGTWLMTGDVETGFESYDDAAAQQPAVPADHETEGYHMQYSSGTTGRPKGVKRPLTGEPMGRPHALTRMIEERVGFDGDTVYLVTGPLYHAAPMTYLLGTHRLGGTGVVMERFDTEESLRLIEEYRVTGLQVVPTLFVRWLKLPGDVRDRYDVSSLRAVMHTGAPCPPEVKRRMIEWWGPILHEVYGGTEGNGIVYIDSHDWLERPGSVGRPVRGRMHVLDDDRRELPAGEVGTVYFDCGGEFEYHNDPEQTAGVTLDSGWSTLGDVGYLDDDGFLYLTDRADFLILSGGRNVYPAEVEAVLIDHPAVLDVAVIGVSDEEYGEAVKAIVQLVDGVAREGVEDALIGHARGRLAAYKCPRSVDVVERLPRLETGKVQKRKLAAEYE